MTIHRYDLFGLRIESAIELPELIEAEDRGEPDVVIGFGEVPVVEDYTLVSQAGNLVLAVPDVARFRIAGGRSITVDPRQGVPARNVRVFLLGSAFGALLHQRGMFPLHANAIDIDGSAVAFMGSSGQGKSTLAAWFHRHGDTVIADDVCVIGFSADGRAYASPGLPRLRLWAEALELMGRDKADYDRSYVGASEDIEKFDVPIKGSSRSGQNVELAGLYLLDCGDEFAISELTGIEAVESVIANTYRGSYLSIVNGQKAHWQASVELVRKVRVFRVTREWGLAGIDSQYQRLRAHVIALATAERRERSDRS